MRIGAFHVGLAIAVALFGGVLPLHVCLPHADGSPSVQVAGFHGHDHGVPPSNDPDAACCVDVPFDRAAPGAPVSVPALAPAAPEGPVPEAAPATPVGARSLASSAAPRERGLIVLLR